MDGIDEEISKSLGEALGIAMGMKRALEIYLDLDAGMLRLSSEAGDDVLDRFGHIEPRKARRDWVGEMKPLVHEA